MKPRDLIGMCLQNLMRRKARTMLTVLGVVIGACAIIIMISIGTGMKESQEKLLSELGDLTIITVTPQRKAKNAAVLNDKALREFRALPGVLHATPKMGLDDLRAEITAGKDKRYRLSYASIVGMEPDALEPLGYKLALGAYPDKQKGGALAGQYFSYAFQDLRRPEGHNIVDRFAYLYGENAGKEMPAPYFDVMRAPLEISLITGEGENEKRVSQKLRVTGVMKEDYGRGYQTGEGLVMDLKELSRLINALKKQAGIKADPNAGYQTVLVKTDGIKSVERIENAIKEMGYGTYSMESIRKPMEKEARQKQLLLGGLGAISLIVAALGITNTMIMSITERTREIGMMKALGCYVRDIRAMFLTEAAMIGFTGGVLGIAASYLISAAMNLVQAGNQVTDLSEAWRILTEKGGRLSVIPAWLPMFALAFSIFIGIGSGYYPAAKAVKISALEAIRHD